MDFTDLVRVGAEPSPTHLSSFVVEHLERCGPARRAELVDAAAEAWQGAAGSPMRTPIVPRMKKALQMLAEQGTIRPSGAYGIWILAEQPQDFSDILDDRALHEVTDNIDDKDEPAGADRVVGTGRQQVYCFYLDVYRDLAVSRGATRWPIKIGMTAGQLASRMQTHATALPEAPHLALVIETENAATLEKVIHGVLTLRGRRTDGTGGTEWFTTSPEEIERIYQDAVGDAGSAR